MNRVPAAFAALSLLAIPAAAQTSDEARTALNNLQHEMSTCIAYYTAASACVQLRDKADPLGQQTSENATLLLAFAMQVGESIDMTKDAMLSRIKMESSTMSGLIQNDCVNFSSLLERYAQRCKRVTENPEDILAEHFSRARN